MSSSNVKIGTECMTFSPDPKDNPVNLFTNCARYLHKYSAFGFQTYLGLPYATTLSKNQKLLLTPTQVKAIKKVLKEEKMKLWIHSSLTINLCREWENHRYKWMWDNLIYDIQQGLELGAQGVVVHLGSSLDMNSKTAIDNMVYNIKQILKESGLIKKKKSNFLILETPAQTGTRIGYNLKEFGKLWNKLKSVHKYLSICVDTQHIFASGYPIQNPNGFHDFISLFKKTFGGLNKLSLIHLNDSKIPLHGKANRHETLKKGFIFKNKDNSLTEIINFAKKNKIMMILETPSKQVLQNMKLVFSKSKQLKEYKQKGGGRGGGGRMDGGGRRCGNGGSELVIDLFEQIRDLHQVLGNIYEAKAYAGAIKSIKEKERIGTGTENSKKIEFYDGLSGIGKGLLEKIKEILKTGKLGVLNELKKDKKVRAIIELSKIRGVGPKQAAKLYEMGFHDVNNVKMNLDGAGMSHTQRIWLKYFDDLNELIPRNEVKKIGNEIKKKVEKEYKDIKVILAGSYRTGKKFSHDVDILLVYDNKIIKNKSINFDKVLNYLRKENLIKETLDEGMGQASVLMNLLKKMRQVDLRWVSKEQEPFYLLFFGSGMEFSRYIRGEAKKQGWKLTEKGLTRLKDGYQPKIKDEKDIFKVLGLEYIKPENRIVNY